MADAVNIRYIYPPNFEDAPNFPGAGLERGTDGSVFSAPKRWILHLTNTSDGTGETKAEKVVLGDHRGITGKVPKRSVIEWVEFDIFGMDVLFYWRTVPADVQFLRLAGGDTVTSGKIRGPIVDPRTGDGTDGTGDILLSTDNHSAEDTYDIRLCVRFKENVRPAFS